MSKVIVVASGKGGTGKTTVSTGIAIAFSRKNKKVLLVDSDCGMRGVDLMLGIDSKLVFDAADVISGNCEMQKAVYSVDRINNLYVLPAPANSDNEISPQLMKQLINQIKNDFDYVIIDSPAGVASNFESACACADQALIVVNPEPISIRGCLNVRTKLMQKGINDIRLVINKFDKNEFINAEFYPDLDFVIDCSQTQLIGLLPVDTRLSCISQCGQAGMYWSKSSAIFDCIAERIEGKNVKIICDL